MLKYAGLAGIILSAGLLGLLQAEKLTQRIRLLEDYEKMILNLKGQMSYFRIPLVEIFQQTALNQPTAAFQLLTRVGADIKENNGEMDQIWAQSVDYTYRNTSLTSHDREILSEPGIFLGQTDFENQKVRFEWLENQLKIQLEEARRDCLSKGPMYRRIGFFGGILAALVLL